MRSILIVAGENSGEKYGANLIRQFKHLQSSFTFFGIGGKNMAEQDVTLLYSVEDLAVVGFFEIISHLPRIKAIFRRIKKETIQHRPVAAVLIDSPDFNLRLAKHLKRASIPVLYYISPTVWAWRKRRLKSIKKAVDKMLLIFPFEEKIYAECGIPAAYVGHPLKERTKVTIPKEEFFHKYRLDPENKLIAILPGSRKSEIKFHMAVLAEAMKKIEKEWKTQFLLPLAENLSQDFVTSFLSKPSPDVRILSQDGYEAMAYSDITLSSCGTANLEAALLGTPQVAFYRISPLSYYAGIRLMKIKNFSIVNILAGKKIIPELIQRDFTVENILGETRKILGSERVRSAIKFEYEKIRQTLGEKTASENAARELEEIVKNQEILKEAT
ncbi:MAG: lipid-A-disaccharide synthase [Candidatus Aminicenantes bacterium]|nr:MAG: lipid-A-disaccharide synthase [Candidatus Aminicenantes bacterium]